MVRRLTVYTTVNFNGAISMDVRAMMDHIDGLIDEAEQQMEALHLIRDLLDKDPSRASDILVTFKDIIGGDHAQA